jgi:hypothetical protein
MVYYDLKGLIISTIHFICIEQFLGMIQQFQRLLSLTQNVLQDSGKISIITDLTNDKATHLSCIPHWHGQYDPPVPTHT